MKNRNIAKTNVMRILDQAKVKYEARSYDPEVIDGISVAEHLGQDMGRVFKTLVTVSKSNQYFVFMIPVNHELDLKKAAEAVYEKNIMMIKMKDLLPLTGYVHGGCSPIGMKKQFTTVIDESASQFETIIFSAGKRGAQIELSLDELRKVLDFRLIDVIHN